MTSPTMDDPRSRPPTPPGEEPPGQIGRFRLVERVGAGSFGVVYRAFDPTLSREVALKVVRIDAHDAPDMVERFQRESRAAADLRHPNIVPVFDAGRDDDRLWIASAFIRGRTLHDDTEARAAAGGLDPRRAAVIVRHLAEALAYAHRQGVIHRDVKPANVMLDEKDQPLLMDFGLAARRDADVRLTREGTLLARRGTWPRSSGGTGRRRPATSTASASCCTNC